jgi:hypothetical protein
MLLTSFCLPSASLGGSAGRNASFHAMWWDLSLLCLRPTGRILLLNTDARKTISVHRHAIHGRPTHRCSMHILYHSNNTVRGPFACSPPQTAPASGSSQITSRG